LESIIVCVFVSYLNYSQNINLMLNRNQCSASRIFLFLFIASNVVAMNDTNQEIGVIVKIHPENHLDISFGAPQITDNAENEKITTLENSSELQRKAVSNQVQKKILYLSQISGFWRFLFTIAVKMIKWGVCSTHDVIRLIVCKSNTLLVFYIHEFCFRGSDHCIIFSDFKR